MKRHHWILSALLLLIGCGQSAQTVDQGLPSGNDEKLVASSEPLPAKVDVFVSSSGNHYRNPSPIQLADGSYLVFAERRDTTSSGSRAAIVYQRVGRDGSLIGNVVTVYTSSRTAFNPSPTATSDGRVLLFFNTRLVGTTDWEICRDAVWDEADVRRHHLVAQQADLNFGSVSYSWTPGNALNNTDTQVISPSQGYEVNGRIYIPTYRRGYLPSSPYYDCNDHAYDQSLVMRSLDNGASFNSFSASDFLTTDVSIAIYAANNVLAKHSRWYVDSQDRHRFLQISYPMFQNGPVNHIAPTVHGGTTLLNNSLYLSFPNATTRQNLIVLNESTDAIKVIEPGHVGASNLLSDLRGIAIVYERDDYTKVTMNWLRAF